MHVLSNTPQTFLYNTDASQNATVAAIQNDQIAKHVKEYPDRFYGLRDPADAPRQGGAAGFERAMTKLGHRGAQIGSNINRKNLDEPEFEPVWEVANKHHALMMVHPTQVAAMDRLGKYYLNNLIGNPLDADHRGRVRRVRRRGRALSQHQVVLRAGWRRHGAVAGRALPARLAGAAGAEGQPQERGPLEKAMASLYYDTTLHAQPQAQALVSIIGPSRIVLGSDYPYDMGTLECARQVKALNISDADKELMLNTIPLKLVGNAGGT